MGRVRVKARVGVRVRVRVRARVRVGLGFRVRVSEYGAWPGRLGLKRGGLDDRAWVRGRGRGRTRGRTRLVRALSPSSTTPR